MPAIIHQQLRSVMAHAGPLNLDEANVVSASVTQGLCGLARATISPLSKTPRALQSRILPRLAQIGSAVYVEGRSRQMAHFPSRKESNQVGDFFGRHPFAHRKIGRDLFLAALRLGKLD